jgi:hypothetical protein
MTAIEWLIIKLYAAGSGSPGAYTKIFEQAKEIEKQQHGNTWDAAIKAHDNRGGVHARSIVDFDEYYNDTFNKTQTNDKQQS